MISSLPDVIKPNEYFISLESDPGVNFNDSSRKLLDEYDVLCQDHGLGPDTEISVRFFLSDITNQAPMLQCILGNRFANSFVSIIGQPPASCAKIALFAYHVYGQKPLLKTKLLDGSIVLKHGSYSSFWHAARPLTVDTSCNQTRQIFGQLSEALENQNANIKDNTVRTWIYVRDVDNNYQVMADKRRELFDTIGLKRSTYYIASTGIEGCTSTVTDLVFMDSLSLFGLEPAQKTFLTAPDYLCPTHEYNVTFERGTTIHFADRTHHYISGTASIDNEGNVVCPGDVIRQVKRTMENMQALLQSGNADIEDLKTIIVYLRDISDYPAVREIVQSILPETVASVYVRGSVCRPQWLVEIEGIAVSPFGDPQFSPFIDYS